MNIFSATLNYLSVAWQFALLSSGTWLFLWCGGKCSDCFVRNLL